MYHSLINDLVLSAPTACVLLQQNGLNVTRSEVPACRNAIDLTIEETIYHSTKTSDGIVGFNCNISAYSRCCLARHKQGIC